MSLRMRRYAEEYQPNTVVTKDGKEKTEYLYTGTRYIMQVQADEYKRLLLHYSLLVIALVILFLSAGLVNTESSRTFYVIMPYAIAVFPIIYIVLGTIRLVHGEREKTHKDYDYSVVRIHKSATAAMILMAMSAIGEILFLIRGMGNGVQVQEIMYLGAMIAASVVLFLLQNLRRKYSIAEEAGEKLRQPDE